DVVAVGKEVVRVDVARDLDQRLQRRRRQRLGVLGPGVSDAETGRGGHCGGRHGRGRALEKDAAVVFVAAIDFSHGYPPFVFYLSDVASFAVQPKRPPRWITSIL